MAEIALLFMGIPGSGQSGMREFQFPTTSFPPGQMPCLREWEATRSSWSLRRNVRKYPVEKKARFLREGSFYGNELLAIAGKEELVHEISASREDVLILMIDRPLRISS